MKVPRFRAGALSALLLSLVAVAAGPVATAQAAPLTENFAISATGGFGNKLHTEADATVSTQQSRYRNTEELKITVRQNEDIAVVFDFRGRVDSGKDLEVGSYDHALSDYVVGRPGIRIGSLDFCGDNSGNFEIRDIQREGSAITRLWITYQRDCYNREPVFGEIRMGYPRSSSYDVLRQSVRWPRAFLQPGRDQGRDVPVVVRGTSADAPEITGVSVTGPHAADFPLRSNGCQGAPTAAGCAVSVGFAPQAPGPRHAELRIATSTGDTTVPLDGDGALGTSAWTVDIDHKDGAAPDHFELGRSVSEGTPYGIHTQAFQDDGTIWDARVLPPSDRTLTAGRYTFDRANTAGGLQAVEFARGNAACVVRTGTVDVDEVAYSGPDDALSLLDVRIDVDCEGYQAVKARFTFRDRADVTAPAQVDGLTAGRVADKVTLTWANPQDQDVAGVLVRWYAGANAPTATDGGQVAHLGTAESADVPASTGTPVAASAWTYDAAGNVSAARTVLVPAG